MILLLLLVFIRYYIGRGRLLFCPCSGCKAASLTELGVGYAWENSPLRLVRHWYQHAKHSSAVNSEFSFSNYFKCHSYPLGLHIKLKELVPEP